MATIIIQNCLYSPGHRVYQSFTSSHWNALPLLHDDVAELADIWDFAHLHLLLEDPPKMFYWVQVWRYAWPVRTVTFSLFNKVVVVLEVRLESLSCWNTALWPSFWREGIMVCCSISQYMLEFMFPSMKYNSPKPAALMQPQTMIFPPPCLTVGMAHLSLYSSLGRRHICLKPSEPNKLIFISSDHTSWFQ